MATFAVTAEHPPDLCPTSNALTRQMLKDGAGQIAHLAGVPLEETIASIMPAVLLTLGAASATLRARVRRTRQRLAPERHDPQPTRKGR